MPWFANRRLGRSVIPCFVFYIIAVILIILYGVYTRLTKRPDVFERKVVDDPACIGFDGWGGLHFIFWLMLGWFFPGHHTQVLLISVVWEGIEDFLGRHEVQVNGKRLQLMGAQDEDGAPIAVDEGETGMRWYGRYLSDPAFNMAGYILGSAAADRWWPNDES